LTKVFEKVKLESEETKICPVRSLVIATMTFIGAKKKDILK